MATNKQTYNTEMYIKKLQERKEEYAKRLEYVADHKIPGSESATVADSTAPAGDTGNAVTDEGVVEGATPEDKRGIFALGKTKMKAPYVFGSAGPNTFDCSGFVYWVYNNSGYEFPRGTALSQYQSMDKVKNPVPGDLIFFSDTWRKGISHVGIWLGNNEMLHTANKTHGVQISPLSDWWKKKKPEWCSPEKFYKGNIPWNRSVNGPGGPAATEILRFAEEVRTASLLPEENQGDEMVYPPPEEEGYYESKTMVIPYVGNKFRGQTMIQPQTTRSVFLHNRVGWVRHTKMKGLKALNKERFIHQAHYDGYEGNLYSPDAKRLFESLLLKTKKPYFEIISGFRFSEPGQVSPHEAGCAMDILVKDIDEAREIADCAWLLGIRSIAIGGDFDEDRGFIHLDIAPKGKDFSYEGVPIYGGPGKWVTK